jgi:hypothetical protein
LFSAASLVSTAATSTCEIGTRAGAAAVAAPPAVGADAVDDAPADVTGGAAEALLPEPKIFAMMLPKMLIPSLLWPRHLCGRPIHATA